MKINAIIRMVTWSLVLLLCLGAFLFLLDRERGVETTAATAVTAPVEEAPQMVERIRKLEIDWPSGTVTIQPGDVREILVEESPVSDEKYTMSATGDGETLTIKYQAEGVPLAIGRSLKKDLTVTVPRDWRGELLKVETTSANVTLRELSLEEVEIESVSGESRFENCTVEELELDTTSGGLYYEGRLGELDVEAVSADVIARLENVPQSMELESVSGGLELALPEDGGVTAEIFGASRFTCAFETTQNGTTYVWGDGTAKLRVDTVSGDVTIQKAGA